MTSLETKSRQQSLVVRGVADRQVEPSLELNLPFGHCNVHVVFPLLNEPYNTFIYLINNKTKCAFARRILHSAPDQPIPVNPMD
jgi:hypothetical protein